MDALANSTGTARAIWSWAWCGGLYRGTDELGGEVGREGNSKATVHAWCMHAAALHCPLAQARALQAR